MAWNLESSIDHCRGMITKGSKSFSWAARIFNAETRDAAFCLYGWCRHCDDVIDGSELGFGGTGVSGSTCSELVQLTKRAYAGEEMDHPVFIAFQHVARKYNIPLQYPLDLLEGMAMDTRKERYETLDDLLLYCYRVAGTVGLMMSPIMGLKELKALKNADDMGRAMQLTNIARDVMEDAAMGRCYLPQVWLNEEGLSAQEVSNPDSRGAVARVVGRILDEAEKLYESGDAGIKYLPFRSALAVSAARQVYSEIGRRVRARGTRAWDSRTVVPGFRKIFVMSRGLMLGRFS